MNLGSTPVARIPLTAQWPTPPIFTPRTTPAWAGGCWPSLSAILADGADPAGANRPGEAVGPVPGVVRPLLRTLTITVMFH